MRAIPGDRVRDIVIKQRMVVVLGELGLDVLFDAARSLRAKRVRPKAEAAEIFAQMAARRKTGNGLPPSSA
jgi:hypothetical protein